MPSKGIHRCKLPAHPPDIDRPLAECNGCHWRWRWHSDVRQWFRADEGIDARGGPLDEYYLARAEAEKAVA